ncbi:MAG: hypothetical protein Fur0037_19790 [Planctomycetota bacterium]
MTDEPDFGSRREFYTFAPESLSREIPDYEIVREVGKGSMGIVYEARRRSDGTRVALKVLPPSLTLTERALARFLREGRIMSRVSHPDIVGVLDQGSKGRLHWFVMEFVEGITLQARLEIGPLPVRQACAIASRIGKALQFAHEHGVVHRDVKPGNLMLRGGPGSVDVAITDFGLARETGTGSMTESGAIVGTPTFMAPETVLGGTALAGTLADVYSLGATLYSMVTGRPPHEGPTAQSVLKDVLERDPIRPSRLRRDLPPPVEAIVCKALERDPHRRYGTALEFSEDLDRWLAGEKVLARLPSIPARIWRACAQRPLPTALGALVFVLAAGAFALERERSRGAMQAALADAQRCLAQASTTRDEQDRPRSEEERRNLLLAAVAEASKVIRADSSFALAWFVRAKAYHRLRQFSEAVFDLDLAEKLQGATPEILHFRIDALRQLGDPGSFARLQQDLRSLLRIDPSPHSRALVAEHLIEIAANGKPEDRAGTLATARDALKGSDPEDARAGVAAARLIEMDGTREDALAAARRLRERFPTDVYVHAQAASMFQRLGAQDEYRRELETLRLLASSPEPVPEARLDLEGVADFLKDVNRLLEAMDHSSPPEKQ